MKRIKLYTTWNRNRIALWVLVLLINQLAFAQKILPILNAKSKTVDVKDGDVFQKNVWNLSPEARPDIYYALEPVREKRITFYSDIDSLSIDVIPGQTYDFIILLNKTDTCYTQISAVHPEKSTQVTMDPFKLIEQESLKQDFTVFREALQKYHAGLYRFKSKNEFDKLLDSCYAALDHPMSSIQFCNGIRYIISAIQCGHTSCSLSAQVVERYSKEVMMFPLQLWFTEEKAYLLCNHKIKIPPSRTELISIDGKPIDEIRKSLFRYLPSDGTIQTKKYWILNRDGFPFLYHFVYGEKNAFTVAYKTETGHIQTITVKADSLKNSQCFDHTHRFDKLLGLDYKPNHTALLTIKTFSSDRLNAAHEDFVTFLKSSFRALHEKKVDRLIIDLRGNGGGDDAYGSLLYSYLTDKPFAYFKSLQSNTKMFLKKADHPGLEAQSPSEVNYKGAVFILIDGLSFSTAADFCAIARSQNRAAFIGEETGGGYDGNNSGESFKTILPHTAINVTIPRMQYINAVKKAIHGGRGIIPDYRVMPTIGDLLQKKDVQLDYALELAQKK